MTGDMSLSVLVDLVEIGNGAVEYLHNKKASNNVARRVSIKFSATSHTDQLMSSTPVNIKCPENLKRAGATHIVTRIDYGADAYLVFERELDSEDHRLEIEGKIKATLDYIPFIAGGNVEGSGTIKNTADKSVLEKFKCMFYGDFVLNENPSTYQEALNVYKMLPSLLKDADGNWKTVPKTIHPADTNKHF